VELTIAQPTAGSQDTEPWPPCYSVAEVAALYRVHVMTIYRALNSERMPEVRRFGRRLVPQQWVDDDLAAQRRTAVCALPEPGTTTTFGRPDEGDR
jgi:excisionase family DNA binding protein